MSVQDQPVQRDHRRDRGEVEALIAVPGVEHFWLRQRDRFADHGLTASDIEEWDSIVHINLIFAVEEEFGIKFSTGDLNGFRSVGNLRSAVGKRLGGA